MPDKPDPLEPWRPRREPGGSHDPLDDLLRPWRPPGHEQPLSQRPLSHGTPRRVRSPPHPNSRHLLRSSDMIEAMM